MVQLGQVIIAGICSNETKVEEGYIQTWDLNTGVSIGPSHKEYSCSGLLPCSVALYPSNTEFIQKGLVALNNHKMGLNYYLLGKERPVSRFFGQDRLCSIVIRPCGEFLVAGNENGKLFGWDIESGKMIFVLTEAHYQKVITIKFSMDGQYLISGSEDGTVRVWAWVDLISNLDKSIFGFSDHTKALNDIHIGFGVDRNFRLLTASKDGRVIMYDMVDGQMLANFEFPNSITAITMSGIESMILAASEDGNIYLVDLISDRQEIAAITQINYGKYDRFCLKGHTGTVTSLILSLDETVLASGDINSQIIVWNLSSRQILRRINTNGPITWISIICKESCEISLNRNEKLVIGQPDRSLSNEKAYPCRIHKCLADDQPTTPTETEDANYELRLGYSRLLDFVFSKFE